MEFYKTEAVQIQMTIPAKMRKMTAAEIIEAISREEFGKAASKPGSKPGRGLQMLEATSKAVFNPADWKAPIYATFTTDAAGADAKEWVKAAIFWYHAAKPLESYIGVYSQGYAAW